MLTRNKRVKTPTLIQLEMAECGAASLGIILAHYGRRVPLAELRETCGVSRDGSKASNVVRAARHYGMEAGGFSYELDELRSVRPPFIVFWQFNHFLVVEGFSKRGVYVNDPASGHRRIAWDEFDADFTGIVLTVTPGKDFVPGGQSRSIVPALSRFLTGNGSLLCFCLLLGLLLVIPSLVLPACSAVFIDSVISDGHTNWLRPLVLVMLAAICVQGTLRAIQLNCLRRMGVTLTARSTGRFLWHLLRLPISFYTQRFPGEVASRAMLNEKLSDVMSGRLVAALIDACTMVLFALVMWCYDARLTLIGIGFAGLSFLTLRWIARGRVEANMVMAQEDGKAVSTAIAGLQSIETIKASGLESGWFAQWSGHFAKSVNARQRLELSSTVLSVLPILLQTLAVAIILFVGALRVMDGSLTIGSLIAFQTLMFSFFAPVATLVSLGGTFQELQGDVGRLEDVLDNTTSSRLLPKHSTASRCHADKLTGHLLIRGLTYGYNKLEEPLLVDFNCEVAPGKWLGIVGSSGSGKSTVARMVGGLFDPWEGSIRFDGKTRDELEDDTVLNSIAVVDQEIMLFEGTVRDNLTLWDNAVSDDALIAACQDAAIYEDILKLPGGLDANLLEGGQNLSGGQRQRLEIARALVHNPTLLVLDEATSALDAETEDIITRNIRRRKCTCVVVAHRYSTFSTCDEIVVLQQGNIVQRGAPDALRSASGPYQALLHQETNT